MTGLPVVESVGHLARLVRYQAGRPLFLRWTGDLRADLDAHEILDPQTGVPLPGLPAVSLSVEPWWGRRSVELWVARKLHTAVAARRPGAALWVISGAEVGRGPDNDSLVVDCTPVARLGSRLIASAGRIWADGPSADPAVARVPDGTLPG
ncbi:hypothetical protein GIS00_13375 [Nakamurella sp. YIM 132087]|uniref:Uncharacterized protein n=1 Tax=Nakamurella alba TaxID=2665158 RepID=A0A7K1FLB4_9ACTN|nr:DUF6098 family protein [Nakamurella alba]MTD14931.1 hypothetical protein [Nakamurella alba]